MEEIKCEQVGQIVGSGFTEMTGRIYSTEGLTPSIRTFSGGNTEVKIAEPIIYDDYNGRIRADQDCIGTLTTNCGNDALRNGVKIIEPRIAAMRGRNPDNPSDRIAGSPTEQRLEIGSEETSNTLTTVQKDNLVVEPTVWGSLQKNCAKKKDGICPTLTSAMGDGGGQIPIHNYDYRIRKLTERECFRLMGVKQDDFERVLENQSTSSLYHLAGDALVTTVLMAILGELFGISDYKDKINKLIDELKENCYE